MPNYSVIKYYGHFKQDWSIKANNEKEALENCEKKGYMSLQTVYREPFPPNSQPIIINLDEKKNDNKIQSEVYYQWLREAAEMGMHISPYEYEKIYGLPFHTI